MQRNSQKNKIMSCNFLVYIFINKVMYKRHPSINLSIPECWALSVNGPLIKLYLSWQDNECDAYHDNHIKLRWPYIRNKIAISYSAECDHNIICTLK